MATIKLHFKKLIIPEGQDVLVAPKIKASHLYDNEVGSGFFLDSFSNARIVEARYVHSKEVKYAFYDVDAMDNISKKIDTSNCVHFTLDLDRKAIFVDGAKTGYKQLAEALSGVSDVSVEMADYEVDVVSALQDLRKSYPNHSIKTLFIKDYYNKDGLMTSANFKVTEHGSIDSLLDTYKSDISNFKLEIIGGVEHDKIKVGMTVDGSVTISGKSDESLREEIIETMMRHDVSDGSSILSNEIPVLVAT